MDTRVQLRETLDAALEGLNGQALLAIDPLVQYDKTHGGDLVRTLQIYLEKGCNASRAAEELFLHRSGLLYRLARIENLLGIRLDVFEDRVALELAVLALQTKAQGQEGTQCQAREGALDRQGASHRGVRDGSGLR
jgi:DNA-binding PucR family transcriptional regulator